jgi:hypothetical protein
MIDLPFYWIFIALAGVVDLVGLFFLWRRRNSPLNTSHKLARVTGVGCGSPRQSAVAEIAGIRNRRRQRRCREFVTRAGAIESRLFRVCNRRVG